MAINTNKSINKIFKGNILDLFQCCFRFSDFSYFSSIFIEGARTIVLSSVLKNKKRANETCVDFFFIESHKK